MEDDNTRILSPHTRLLRVFMVVLCALFLFSRFFVGCLALFSTLGTCAYLMTLSGFHEDQIPCDTPSINQSCNQRTTVPLQTSATTLLYSTLCSLSLPLSLSLWQIYESRRSWEREPPNLGAIALANRTGKNEKSDVHYQCAGVPFFEYAAKRPVPRLLDGCCAAAAPHQLERN